MITFKFVYNCHFYTKFTVTKANFAYGFLILINKKCLRGHIEDSYGDWEWMALRVHYINPTEPTVFGS
jgi:hypothetical protein